MPRPRLPPPLFQSASATARGAIADARAALEKAEFLSASDFAIVANLLPYFRYEPHVRWIATLSAGEVHHLALILLFGLDAARSWGCSARTSQAETPVRSPTTADPGLPPGDRLLASAGASAGASRESVVKSLTSIFTGIGFADSLPLRELNQYADDAVVSARHQLQDDECAKRQDQQCPITLRQLSNQSTPLLPFVVKLEQSHFWPFLALVFGPRLCDDIWRLAGGDRYFSVANALYLDNSLQFLFDQGHILLEPVISSDNNDNSNDDADDARADFYDIRFRWVSSDKEELNTWFIKTPSDVASQVVGDRRRGFRRPQLEPQGRPLCNGDLFRLYTNDRKELPLPHPILFDLRIAIWHMLRVVGLRFKETL